MREVHEEGMRERANMREHSTDHDHEDPKPKKRTDGRLQWCCPHAYSIAKSMGKFNDAGEYVGEFRD